jgi:hypothetical protein
VIKSFILTAAKEMLNLFAIKRYRSNNSPHISLAEERIVNHDIRTGISFPGDKQNQFLKLSGIIWNYSWK